MKKIIAAALLALCACVFSACGDSSECKDVCKDGKVQHCVDGVLEAEDKATACKDADCTEECPKEDEAKPAEGDAK